MPLHKILSRVSLSFFLPLEEKSICKCQKEWDSEKILKQTVGTNWKYLRTKALNEQLAVKIDVSPVIKTKAFHFQEQLQFWTPKRLSLSWRRSKKTYHVRGCHWCHCTDLIASVIVSFRSITYSYQHRLYSQYPSENYTLRSLITTYKQLFSQAHSKNCIGYGNQVWLTAWHPKCFSRLFNKTSPHYFRGYPWNPLNGCHD